MCSFVLNENKHICSCIILMNPALNHILLSKTCHVAVTELSIAFICDICSFCTYYKQKNRGQS